jgi:hypothetical protein
MMEMLFTLGLGFASALIASLIPHVVAYIQSKTHSTRLATIAQIGGDVAYKSLVAAAQAGGDYQKAEQAAVQAGIAAVRNALPALVSFTDPAIESAVASGLGAALKADPTIGVAVTVKPSPTATATTPASASLSTLNNLAKLAPVFQTMMGNAAAHAPALPEKPPSAEPTASPITQTTATLNLPFTPGSAPQPATT